MYVSHLATHLLAHTTDTAQASQQGTGAPSATTQTRATSQHRPASPPLPVAPSHTWQCLEHQLQLRHHVGHLTTGSKVHLGSTQVGQRLGGVQAGGLRTAHSRKHATRGVSGHMQ